MYLLSATREHEGLIVGGQPRKFSKSARVLVVVVFPGVTEFQMSRSWVDQCVGQLAQCDAMLDGRGSNASLSHLGMIWMLYGDVEDSLSQSKELLRSQRVGQLLPGLLTQFDIRPLCHVVWCKWRSVWNVSLAIITHSLFLHIDSQQ